MKSLRKVSRHLIAFAGFLLLLASGGAGALDIQRCLNVLGDDQEWHTDAGHFKTHHLDVIKSAGFDTIRLNLKVFRKMSDDGQIDREWQASLKDLVDAALARRLTVILDQHDFRACGRDYAECQVKLPAFWEQISRQFAGYPEQLIYELHNEPNGEFSFERWNQMIPRLMGIVRGHDASRKVIIGPAGWNSFSNVGRLQFPDDRNVIATFHYYFPLEFTHQGVPNYPHKRSVVPGSVKWGSVRERLDLVEYLDRIRKWSLSSGRPVLLGEFGVYQSAPSKALHDWNRDFILAAETRKLGWCYYQFEGSFGIYSLKNDAWLEGRGVIDVMRELRSAE